MARQGHNRITSNGKGSGDLSQVTQGILNLKSHGVLAGIQSHVTAGGHGLAGNRCGNRNTVHQNGTGSRCQSLVIRHLGRESHSLSIDRKIVCQISRGVSACISYIGNGRQNTIIHCGTVVQGNIINIERMDCRGSGFHIGTNEGRRTTVAFIIRHGGAQIIVLRNINRCINPAGFRDIRLSTRIQVLFDTADGSKHEVILLAAVASIRILHIELRLEGQTGSTFGDIQPHTQSGCVLSICHIAQNNGLAHVEEDIIGPISKSSIGIIQAPGQSVVATLHLTTVCSRSHKGGAADLFIELTGQRTAAH